MSRSRLLLRDVALGYASRGIPILPLHYPLPHRSGGCPEFRGISVAARN
jgi:hypothetical protein